MLATFWPTLTRRGWALCTRAFVRCRAFFPTPERGRPKPRARLTRARAHAECNHIPEAAACVNWLQGTLLNTTRLGIPLSIIGETLVAGTNGATIFPQPVLRGASFDVALEARIGASIARQARLGGIDRGLSPVLQVDTDVRFGRFEEAYGEDPFLVSVMGVAVATALQGSAAGPRAYLPSFTEHISCEAKHALAYGFGGRDW